jgi:Mor family transcriptional regulator
MLPFDMDSDSKAERNAKIHARRNDGLSLRAIGREFRLSTETVREIARRTERKAKWLEYNGQTLKP